MHTKNLGNEPKLSRITSHQIGGLMWYQYPTSIFSIWGPCIDQLMQCNVITDAIWYRPNVMQYRCMHHISYTVGTTLIIIIFGFACDAIPNEIWYRPNAMFYRCMHHISYTIGTTLIIIIIIFFGFANPIRISDLGVGMNKVNSSLTRESPLQTHTTHKIKTPTLFPAPCLMRDWKEKALKESWGWESKYAEFFQLSVGRRILFPMKH